MASRYGQDAMDDLIFLNELQQYAQPYTTGVSQFIPSEQEFEANRLESMIAREGSIQQPESVLGEEELMNIAMGSAIPGAGVGASIKAGAGGASILKRLLSGIFKKGSKKKFPIGYGQPTYPSQTVATDDAVKLLEELGFTKKGTMTKEAERLFGVKPSPTAAKYVPRKVWK